MRKATRAQWVKFGIVTLLYLMFLVWVKSWWGLIVLPFIFDVYISKKIPWSFWKKSKNPAVRGIMSWVDAIVFALVAVYFVNIYIFQNYQIPSSSLEKSLLVGDFLYSRSFEMMVELGSMPVMKILSQATRIIAEGEVLQLSKVRDASTTEETYMEVIRGKTAMLFEASTHSAAALAGATPEQSEALRTFGDHLGVAFQLVDDLLGSGDYVQLRKTAETLSGIPSIVYGLFGMLFFVTYLKWGYSILAGAATLAIMVLPLIMRTTEEALLAVSDSYREASFGVGAGKLRTVFKIVLPAAMPGILSGVILAIGRIVGETAALIYTAGTVAEVSKGLLSSGRTLAIHMYVLSSEGLYTNQAYATAVVLFAFILIINLVFAFFNRRSAKK